MTQVRSSDFLDDQWGNFPALQLFVYFLSPAVGRFCPQVGNSLKARKDQRVSSVSGHHSWILH